MNDEVEPQPRSRVSQNLGRIVFETQAHYRSGMADPDIPLLCLPEDCTDARLGEALLSALAGSRFVPPGTPDFDRLMRGKGFTHEAWTRRILKAFGVKTQKALFAGMKLVTAYVRAGTLTFHPWLQTGKGIWTRPAEESFHGLTADTPPEKIGAMLREALARSGTA